MRTVVRAMKAKGADGLKLNAWAPDLMAAAIDEATKNGMGTTAHLAQIGVPRMNAMDAARLGLGTVTHFYGLFEAMYDDNQIQPYPDTYNYNDEQWRFGQVARQWNLVTPRSEKWMALLDTLKAHNVTLDPTMVAYLAGRDVVRRRTAEWHDAYTLPSLTGISTRRTAPITARTFSIGPRGTKSRGTTSSASGTMLLNDYKNMGGRVTVSTDAGFIYNTYGFATVEEMEMLQEAGFHPLEVIRAATMHAAETLALPTGKPIEIGVVRRRDAGGPRGRTREPDREPENALRHRFRQTERQDGEGGAGWWDQVHDQGRHHLRRAKTSRRRSGHGGEAKARARSGAVEQTNSKHATD